MKSTPVHHFGRFPKEKDKEIIKKWKEFWISFCSPIKVGIILIVTAVLWAILQGSFLEFVNICTFQTSNSSFLIQKILAFIGAILFSMGIYNLLMNNWRDHHYS